MLKHDLLIVFVSSDSSYHCCCHHHHFFFIIFFFFLANFFFFNLLHDFLDFTQSFCLINDKFISEFLFSYFLSFFLLFYIHLSLPVRQTYLIQLMRSSDVTHHFRPHYAVLNHRLFLLSRIK